MSTSCSKHSVKAKKSEHFAQLTVADLERINSVPDATPLCLYLYCNIKGMTEYADGYKMPWDRFLSHLQVQSYGETAVLEALELLQQSNLICYTFTDGSIVTYAINYSNESTDVKPSVAPHFRVRT